MRNCCTTPFSIVPKATSWNSSAQSIPTPSTLPPHHGTATTAAAVMVLGGPGRRYTVLMNQSSRDHTLLGVRPSPGPSRGAVSHQSSGDKRVKRSLPVTTVRKEGRAISNDQTGSEIAVSSVCHHRRGLL